MYSRITVFCNVTLRRWVLPDVSERTCHHLHASSGPLSPSGFRLCCTFPPDVSKAASHIRRLNPYFECGYSWRPGIDSRAIHVWFVVDPVSSHRALISFCAIDTVWSYQLTVSSNNALSTLKSLQIPSLSIAQNSDQPHAYVCRPPSTDCCVRLLSYDASCDDDTRWRRLLLEAIHSNDTQCFSAYVSCAVWLPTLVSLHYIFKTI